MLYNAATVWAHQGRLGLALWGWQRALRLGAQGVLADDIRHDIDVARGALLERYRDEMANRAVVLSQPRSFAWQVFHQFDGPALAWVAGLLWALGWLAWMALRASRRPPGLRLRVTVTTPVVAGFLAVGYYAGNRLTVRGVRMAVVVVRNATLHEGRHPDAPAHALPEGIEVALLDPLPDGDDALVEVKLPNGTRGSVAKRAPRAV